MNLRVAFLIATTFLLPLKPPAAAPAKAPASPQLDFAQVRGEFVDLDGNLDEVDTTLRLVNRSLSATLTLGDIYAVGRDGLSEVLSTHTGSNGVTLGPLASLDLKVDPSNFPGLLPKIYRTDRGLESVVVSFSGPREALRLSAAIHLQQPGTLDNRVITLVEGHCVMK